MAKICLIIDNPLRDLDGICLIARKLCQYGHHVFVVPMNTQGFDVPSIKPDVVLVNYCRKNNINQIIDYHNQGIKVAILDTEGVGSWWPNFAAKLAKLNIQDFVSQYLCWGSYQKDILISHNVLPSEMVTQTGLPRYDFLVAPYRDALPAVPFDNPFILINTNFPAVNPLFSKNSATEIKSWADDGLHENKMAVQSFVEAAYSACDGMQKAIIELAKRFPEEVFVIRPHPFENLSVYEKLAHSYANISVFKEGTSLQWLNKTKVLLHLNCMTAIEASYMGVEAIGFEWLNHDILRNQTPETSNVTRHAHSIEEICEFISHINMGANLPPLPKRDNALDNYAIKLLGGISGDASLNVAKVLHKLSKDKKPIIKREISPRQKIIRTLRYILGFKLSLQMKKLKDPKSFRERENKIPTLQTYKHVNNRIAATYTDDLDVVVENVQASELSNFRTFSFQSVRFSLASKI